MKKPIIIGVLIIITVSFGFAQKVIPAGTAISAVTTLPNGLYVAVIGTDSVFFSKDTTLSIVRFKHDTVTVTRPCPVCPTIPLCPPPTKQRTVNGFPAWDPVNKRWIYPYDDGTTTTL